MNPGLQGQLQTWMEANDFLVTPVDGADIGRCLPGHSRPAPYDEGTVRAELPKSKAGPRSIVEDKTDAEVL